MPDVTLPTADFDAAAGFDADSISRARVMPSATIRGSLSIAAAGVSRLRPMSAMMSATSGFSANALGRNRVLPTALFPARLRIVAPLYLDRPGLGVADIVNEIALMWGLRGICELRDWDRRRALHDLNRAMQILWNRAPDRKYWTQGSLEITFIAGVGVVEMENEIQNIVGEASLANGQTLVPCGTISEIEQFTSLFLDSAVAAVPVAYYVERVNQGGSDPARCRIHISPVPAADTVMVINAVFESPRFGVNDISRNTPVPIPHRYAESLLLPVVRYYAAQYWQSQVDEEQRKSIEVDYREVAGLLGLADPLPGLSGDNRARREEAVA
jgi:hypothetical protein